MHNAVRIDRFILQKHPRLCMKRGITDKIRDLKKEKPIASVSFNPINEGFYIGNMSDGNSFDGAIRLAYLKPDGFKKPSIEEGLEINEDSRVQEMYTQYENNRKRKAVLHVDERVINDIGLMKLCWIALRSIYNGQSQMRSAVRNIPWDNTAVEYDVADEIETDMNTEMTLTFRQDAIVKDDNTKTVINVHLKNANLWRLVEEQNFKVTEACKIVGQHIDGRVRNEIMAKCTNTSTIRGDDIDKEMAHEVNKLMVIKLDSAKLKVRTEPDSIVMNPATLDLLRDSTLVKSGALKPYCDWLLPKNTIYLLDKSKVTMADGVFTMSLFKKGIIDRLTNENAMEGRIQMIKHIMPNTKQEILDASCVKIQVEI